MVDVPHLQLVDAIQVMCFRYSSGPANVTERSYFANNSTQKEMSQEIRFLMAKNNFPARVSLKFSDYYNYKCKISMGNYSL